MTDVRFAIVGVGVAGRYHASAIAQTEGARLVAVCREHAAQISDIAEQFGLPVYARFEDLLAQADVDVVCICTPSGMHARQAIAAAQAGKHVLVEKPIALSLADADEVIATCYKAGVKLGVALQRRTDPSFRAVHDAITSGELGKTVLGTISIPYWRAQSYYDSAAWRGTYALDGGGVLMNQGIHIVDLLMWFMGDVVSVQAQMDTLAHAIEVEDDVTATLRFANGALGSIAATTATSPGFPHRIEVYGERGGIQIEGESIVRWESATPNLQFPIPNFQLQAAGAGASPTAISAEGHTRIVADLVSAIREGREPLVTGMEARRSLALVLAVYEAARTGKPVRL